MKGLEPSTFCMASRRSSQLSYIREERWILAMSFPGDACDRPIDPGGEFRSERHLSRARPVRRCGALPGRSDLGGWRNRPEK